MKPAGLGEKFYQTAQAAAGIRVVQRMAASGDWLDAQSRPARARRKRDGRTWLPWIVALIVIGAAAPLLAYVVPRLPGPPSTTVSLLTGSWKLPEGGGYVYLPMCGWGGANVCPSALSPGSVYVTYLNISNSYKGQNASLSIPSPFSLVGTVPGLPADVTSNGLEVQVSLRLPSAPGQYDFLGTVVFT